jgi:phosphoribosyl-AMP cyclohydrolase
MTKSVDHECLPFEADNRGPDSVHKHAASSIYGVLIRENSVFSPSCRSRVVPDSSHNRTTEKVLQKLSYNKRPAGDSLSSLVRLPFVKNSPIVASGYGDMSNAEWPDFSKNELIPAIAQDAESGDVLMMAWMNQEAFDETIRTGRVVYFSRSRQKLWRKGEESGNVQELKSLYFDCDADTLLVKVNQVGGAACHTGHRSCFFRRIDTQTKTPVTEGERVFDPDEVYRK